MREDIICSLNPENLDACFEELNKAKHWQLYYKPTKDSGWQKLESLGKISLSQVVYRMRDSYNASFAYKNDKKKCYVFEKDGRAMFSVR